MKKLVILGCGGHGRTVAEVAVMNGYSDIVFLDDNAPEAAGKTSDYRNYLSDHDFFIAIGSAIIRRQFFEILSDAGADIVNIIHPSAIISPSAVMGRGCVIMAGAVLDRDAVLGNGVIVNINALVGHDSVIGDFTHISAAVAVAGTVRIGENNWLGIGTVTTNNITVCDNCYFGAGAVIIGDITEEGTYVGVPVRKL